MNTIEYLSPIQSNQVVIEGEVEYSRERKAELKKKKTRYCNLISSLVELTLKEFNASNIKVMSNNEKQTLTFKANMDKKVNRRELENEIKKSGGYAINKVSILPPIE